MTDKRRVRRDQAEERTGNLEMLEAGTRFEAYVTEARAELGLSLAELARRSGIAASAWHAWFRGAHKPRRNSLALAAPVLRRSPDQLAAAWAGGRPPARHRATETPDKVAAAIDALADRLDRLEASLRALEAEVGSLRAPREDGASSTRSAPHGSAG